jgi:ferredoxin
VFNTYGNASGRTLKAMERLVAARGFRVIAGHSLHTPENYPPMIAGGKGNEQAPDKKELREFKAFVAGLSEMLDSLKAGQEIGARRMRIGLLSRVMPILPRTTARRQMGEKHVDESLCTECGACAEMCPYRAIRLAPKPVFDPNACYGCWRCYNRCPQKAIYTRKLRGVAHYPKPLEALRKKLGENS